MFEKDFSSGSTTCEISLAHRHFVTLSENEMHSRVAHTHIYIYSAAESNPVSGQARLLNKHWTKPTGQAHSFCVCTLLC